MRNNSLFLKTHTVVSVVKKHLVCNLSWNHSERKLHNWVSVCVREREKAKAKSKCVNIWVICTNIIQEFFVLFLPRFVCVWSEVHHKLSCGRRRSSGGLSRTVSAQAVRLSRVCWQSIFLCLALHHFTVQVADSKFWQQLGVPSGWWRLTLWVHIGASPQPFSRMTAGPECCAQPAEPPAVWSALSPTRESWAPVRVPVKCPLVKAASLLPTVNVH